MIARTPRAIVAIVLVALVLAAGLVIAYGANFDNIYVYSKGYDNHTGDRHGGDGHNDHHKGNTTEDRHHALRINATPCIVNGTVAYVGAKYLVLDMPNGTRTIVVLPGYLWYVEPEGKFVNAKNVSTLIKVGDVVKVVGVCMSRACCGKSKGISGTTSVVVGGIVFDETAGIRISRVA